MTPLEFYSLQLSYHLPHMHTLAHILSKMMFSSRGIRRSPWNWIQNHVSLGLLWSIEGVQVGELWTEQDSVFSESHERATDAHNFASPVCLCNKGSWRSPVLIVSPTLSALKSIRAYLIMSVTQKASEL